MHNEADDYKMIDRAAGVAFSNLQKPVVRHGLIKTL